MAKKSYPLTKVHHLLGTGPVVLVSTAFKGRPNIMTLAWHTMIEFKPALVGCVVSDENASFNTLKKTKQCVINIPTKELAGKVVLCGTISGTEIDKFEKFRFTAKASTKVSAPRIEECYANLECTVVDTKMTAAYGLFILEVVQAWVDPSKKNPKTLHHRGGADFMVAGETITVKSKCD